MRRSADTTCGSNPTVPKTQKIKIEADKTVIVK